jgi:tRNA-intron endonuclease
MGDSEEIIIGKLSRNKVYVELSPEVKELRERGFGDLKNKKVIFTTSETLYLIEKGKIKVVNNKGEQVNQKDLASSLAIKKTESWIKYLIYRDLRDRGYIVRESSEFDFEVYGKGALRRLVSIIHEGRDTSLERLDNLLKSSKKEKKELILAVIDRRTDIVYYTLDSLRM